MDNKFKKHILKILFQEGQVVQYSDLREKLVNNFGYNNDNDLGNKLNHYLKVLESEDKIEKEEKVYYGGSLTVFCISLLSEGYKVFDPWYTKLWRFFTTDFAKILSIIATLLSIIAVSISLLK